jgi:hypothetical protein
MEKQDQFPNKKTIDVLSNHQDTQAILFLCYQVKMEGRLISQHSLRQHASCDYIAQVPIERLTSPKERLKEL